MNKLETYKFILSILYDLKNNHTGYDKTALTVISHQINSMITSIIDSERNRGKDE